MTEEEAKTKACCGACGEYSRQHLRPDGTSIRVCVGSQCMAWQWINTPESVNNYRASCQTSPNPSIVATGFCGLAGKP